MKDLVNFFISFDKLMKEKLVRAFFWLALILILLTFFAEFLAAIHLGPLAWVLDVFKFIVKLLLTIVGLRLLCEVIIALFRINDNLSPDGGKSETADIDPLEEAVRAAEEAAKRAREATNKVVARTKSAAGKSDVDDDDPGLDDLEASNLDDAASSAAPAKSSKPAAKKKTSSGKTAPAKSTTTKKTATKTGGSTRKKTTSGTALKKDGTPRKKPGPKPKS